MSHIEIDSIKNLSTERLNELIAEGNSEGTSNLGPAHKELYDAMVEEVQGRQSGGLELPADALSTEVDEAEDASEEEEATGPDSYGREPVNYGEAEMSKGSGDFLEREGYGAGGFEYFETKTPISYKNALAKLNAIRNAAGGKNPSKQAVDRYKTFTKNLKKYTDTDYESGAGEIRAFETLLKDAQGGSNSATELLNGAFGPGSPGGGDGDSGGKYKGPVTTTSSTITDEISAKALLNNYARDLIGRDLNDKEVDKYVKQFNRLEKENPQVSVSTPGVGRASSVTNTAASKEELLRQVVSSNPDYAKFQIDTTIMDMLLDDIEKGKAVING